jgi:hypothetical protein
LLHSFSQTIVDIFFVTKDTAWALGGTTGILKSIDGGFNWFTQNNPGTVAGESKMFFLNNKKGWVGVFLNRILATVDGENWGYQTTPAISNYSVQFVDSLRGWAGSSILIHTTDGGGVINPVRQISTEVPSQYKLYQNYPNPFNPSTNIKYQITKSKFVTLKIFDITGKEIATLVNQKQNAGTYETEFSGEGLASGIYFYSLVVENNIIDTKKMILVK